jgi:lipopolysaccharide/colanic/teichoic acid biosynthesis glycosyltransferase
MAAGKPILMAVAGDTADLIERAQCGVLAQPGNPQSIADAVKELYEAGPARRAAMGRRGREFYERELSASAGADRFDTVLRKAASQAKQLRQRGWRLMLKRALDISVAGAGLILLAPVLAGVAALVWLSMRSPILFRQERPGRFGKPMRVLKFRSMSAETDGSGVLLPDAMRLTAAGRLLRSTSLDELPQLWNVLKGDLSLVGPRPLLTEYLPRYSERQATRHDVLPGITGWAQINGRNDLSWNAKLALDAWYVEHWTLLLDLKILALTLPRVLLQHGISRSGHATTPGFLDEGE